MPGFADDVTRLVPHLRRFARALVRGHSAAFADDLVQETVVLAMRAERLARGPDLTSWCFATLMRVHRVTLVGSAGPQGMAARETDQPSAALAFLPKDIARLDHLPLEERETLLLASLVGMGYAQIAATLHVTVDIVMLRLDQARHHLARMARPGWAAASEFGAGRHGRATHLRLVK